MPQRRQANQFARIRGVEASYAAQLRKIARHIDDLVRGLTTQGLEHSDTLERLLRQYAKLVEPWAQTAASKMVAAATQRADRAWRAQLKGFSKSLQRELVEGPIGPELRDFLASQVKLITSIPEQAADRVHELALQAQTQGTRERDRIIDELMQTGDVSKSRATLIARTETARVANAVTMVRAQNIGSETYVWRTLRDRVVRPSHRAMEGQVIRWDTPPEVDPGKRYHAGMFPNCFTGDTLVFAEDPVRLFRMWYRGPMCALQIGDATVEVTPNHPILARNGWRAANSLNAGDEIAQVLTQTGDSVVNQINQSPTTFDQLFHSFTPSLLERHPGAIFDFYGDVPDGEVDIITIPGDLARRVDADQLQRTGDKVIAGANVIALTSFIERGIAQIGPSLLSCGLNVRDFLLWCSGFCQELVGDIQWSQLDAVAFQEFLEGRTGYAIAGGDAGAAFSGRVGLDGCRRELHRDLVRAPLGNADSELSQMDAQDVGMAASGGSGVLERGTGFDQGLRVQDTRVRDFSGHVYTLETGRGYYAVSGLGVATKNCRCYPEPIIPDRFA